MKRLRQPLHSWPDNLFTLANRRYANHLLRPLWLVVFSGTPGLLYGPVKTQFGYHLIVIKSLS